MAFALDIEMTIGAIKLNFCSDIEVVSTWQELTNTALIKIPKKIRVNGSGFFDKLIQDVIKVEDVVIIKAGYNGALKEEFRGYVSQSPKPSIPIEIACEDEMFMLKRNTVANKSWANANVKDIVKHIAPSYRSDVLDAEIGKFIIGLNGAETAAIVLKRLNDDFGIKSFFKTVNGKSLLVVGKPYMWYLGENAPEKKEVTYHLQKNVRAINLQYKNEADKKIKIEAKLMKPDGKTIEAKFKGDAEGDTRTLHYYGISEAALEKRAKEDYNLMKKSGYDGEITGWAIPFTQPGMIARVIDEFYEKRDERYFIDKVVLKVSNSGVERINTLGRRVEL